MGEPVLIRLESRTKSISNDKTIIKLLFHASAFLQSLYNICMFSVNNAFHVLSSIFKDIVT